MRNFKAVMLVLVFVNLPAILFAQAKQTQFGELMRSNGRIYVVVAVMLTILAGLIIYLVRVDKKISRLERNEH